MKFKMACDWCGKEIYRTPAKIKNHNFCSRDCLSKFSNKSLNPNGYHSLKDFTNISSHCSEMNRELNPTRMTEEVRRKISESRIDSGSKKSYRKKGGRHEHRTVAETILGRPLVAGEVVHHRDGNKRNNTPNNLVIFASQSEHAKHHAELKCFIRQLEIIENGGDA